MKPITSKLTVATMLWMSMQLTAFHSSAQVSQADKEKLTELSRIQVVDRNACFLITELLKDGLLQENERVNLLYSDKLVTLNGKEIPEPNNNRYTQMLRNGGFVGTGGGTGSISADGQSITKALCSASAPDHRYNSDFQNYDRLTKLLVEDGLANKADDLTIDIAADYVAVNGRILATPIEKAYEYHFRELSGFKPTGGEVFSMVIKHTPKK